MPDFFFGDPVRLATFGYFSFSHGERFYPRWPSPSEPDHSRSGEFHVRSRRQFFAFLSDRFGWQPTVSGHLASTVDRRGWSGDVANAGQSSTLRALNHFLATRQK